MRGKGVRTAKVKLEGRPTLQDLDAVDGNQSFRGKKAKKKRVEWPSVDHIYI